MNSSAPTTARSMAVRAAKALPRPPGILPYPERWRDRRRGRLCLTVSQADHPLQARNPTVRSDKSMRACELARIPCRNRGAIEVAQPSRSISAAQRFALIQIRGQPHHITEPNAVDERWGQRGLLRPEYQRSVPVLISL